MVLGVYMNNDLLANSLKAHLIFSYFWNDSILDCFEGEIELDVFPQDPFSFYQKKLEIPLHNLGKSPELSGLNAKALLTLTSFYDKFLNVDKAISNIDLRGATHAILILVSVMNEDKRVIFSTQFNLGSQDSEQINTDSKYLKRFSFLY
jgi:hypothetical protein